MAFNLEDNKFFIRYTGERPSDWETVYEGDSDDESLRFSYAEHIAGLYALNGLDVPKTIKMYLPGYVEVKEINQNVEHDDVV